jgi:U3 small nucleolar RNA-associated protein MPP10
LKQKPLKELYVEGMDSEQIWEQIKLYNAPLLEFIEQQVSTALQSPENIELKSLYEKEESNEPEEEDIENGDIDEEFDMDDEEIEEEMDTIQYDKEEEEDEEENSEEEEEEEEEDIKVRPKKSNAPKNPKDFFSMDDMERFIENAEEEEEKEREGEEDEFKDMVMIVDS